MKVACKLYFLGTRVHSYINVCVELRQNAPCSRDLLKKKLAHVDQRDADQRGSPVPKKPPVKKPKLEIVTFFFWLVAFWAPGYPAGRRRADQREPIFFFSRSREHLAFGRVVLHTFIYKCTRVFKMYCFQGIFIPFYIQFSWELRSTSELTGLWILNSGFGILNH